MAKAIGRESAPQLYLLIMNLECTTLQDGTQGEQEMYSENVIHTKKQFN